MKKLLLLSALMLSITLTRAQWLITGNAGTNSTTNFIGTTDAQDLVFKTSNTEWMRLKTTTGRLGIGTTLPAAKFQVIGSCRLGGVVNYAKTDTSGNLSFAGAALYNVSGDHYAFKVTGSNFLGLYFSSTAGQYQFLDNSNVVLFDVATNNGNGYLKGKLGIGITTPTAQLEVAGGDAKINGVTVGKGAGTGAQNTVVGTSALNANTTGNYNTANGWNALLSNTTGNYNTASGTSSLQSNTTGSTNTSNGSGAMLFNTTGSFNTASGANALEYNSTGNNNTALGVAALEYNISGTNNVAIGRSALNQNGSVSNLVAIGDSSLFFNVSGIHNTAIGSKALFKNNAGNRNTAVGKQALFQNTSGNDNTSVGAFSLGDNTTGEYNTANGTSALRYNTTGSYNTAVGDVSLSLNTTGSNNTAIGYLALYFPGASVQNTAFGSQALASTTTGGANTAGGFKTMYSNSGGADNTAFGNQALYSNNSGNSNVAVGNGALYTNTTGSRNTALGDNAYVSTGSLTNATAIGANAIVSTSNSLVLGSINGSNGATSNVNVGIGTSSPTFKVDIVGAPNGIRLLSGSSTSFTSFQIGRAVTEGTLGIASASGLFASDASAGDVILRTESTSQKLLLGTGTSHSTMSINNGKVGIGVTSPTFQLDVLGDAHFSTGNTTNCDLVLQTSTTNMALFAGGTTDEIGIYNLATSKKMASFQGDGQVRIGTTHPSTGCAFTAALVLGSTGGSCIGLGIQLQNTDTTFWNIYSMAASQASDLRFECSTGAVGYCSGFNGGFTVVSDQRLKKDIVKIPSVLDGVRQLRPVSFHLLFNKPTDPLSYGFIAQEVLKIFPGIVSSFYEQNGDLRYAINYDNFAVYSIKAIQELDSVVSTKEEKIENLESTDAEIQSHLNKTDETLAKLDSISKVQEQSISVLNSLSNRNDQLTAENESLQSTIGSLQNELAEMKNQMQQFDQSLSECCTSYKSSVVSPQSLGIDLPKLEQNVPNPFNESTIIKFYLPLSSSHGVIKIYSFDGTEMKSFPITRTGYGEISIAGNSLASGVYAYVLIIDGKAIDTKQMILTK